MRAVILAGLLALVLIGSGRAQDDPLGRMRQSAGEALGRGEYREAERLYREVIRRKNGQKDLTLGWTHFGLGKVYSELGRYSESKQQFESSAEIFKDKQADNKTRATVRNSLGYILTEMGLYREASASLAEAELLFPDDAYAERVVMRLNQARLARRLGQYEEAEKLLLRVVKFYNRDDQRQNALGKVNQGYALNALANVYVDWGKSIDAEKSFEEGLAHWQSLGGGKAALIGEGSARSNLAYFQQRRKDRPNPAEAKRQYTQALDLLTRGTESGDLRVAQVQVNLGYLHYLDGSYAVAQELFEKSEAARSARWGTSSPDHPELVLGRYNLALAHAAQGRPVKAAELMEEARRSTRRFLANELPALGEPAQLDFLTRQRDDWNAVLSLGAADPRVAALAAGWILNHKGITLDLSGGAKAAKDPWVDLRDVRRTLPKGSVLVEIAHFRNWNLRPRGSENPEQSPRYVAWLIPAEGEGDVLTVPLGGPNSGKQIDDAVKAVREELDTTPERIAREDEEKERGTERRASAALGKLSKLVFDPIRQHVRKGNHLILSPDADLWQVPWIALPLTGVETPRTLNGVAYALEHYPISYVTSGRDLLRSDVRAATGQSVVLADLNYRKAPGRTIQIPTDGDPIDAEPFKPLRASADEGRAVEAALKKYTGVAPVLATEDRVTADFLKKIRQPQVLFVSTHGYSLPSKDDAVIRRPLARTGLALSGANESPKNIATGEAIREMDLAGTELVMLSACETARGKILADAQGTRSLRQAFHQAGARSVVAAQWSVPDTETADVMKRFFSRLNDKRGKMVALRQAQLDFIAARRADVGVAHPFYWAGFTLSGDWD